MRPRRTAICSKQGIKLSQEIAETNLADIVARKLVIQQAQANHREQVLLTLAQDVKTLLHWFSHDVLALAGPSLAVRQELFDFIDLLSAASVTQKQPLVNHAEYFYLITTTATATWRAAAYNAWPIESI